MYLHCVDNLFYKSLPPLTNKTLNYHWMDGILKEIGKGGTMIWSHDFKSFKRDFIDEITNVHSRNTSTKQFDISTFLKSPH